MPDIAFRSTEEFKNLDGQSMPSEELLRGIFKNARFDTRFYREVERYENPNFGVNEDEHGNREEGYERKGKFLISAALEPPASSLDDFDTWYRDEHLSFLARSPSFIRTRRYELVEGSTLNEFQRTEPEDGIPRFLALHEYSGTELPWKVLEESARTEWAERVMGGLVKNEVGWYVVKREYEEGEWGTVGT